MQSRLIHGSIALLILVLLLITTMLAQWTSPASVNLARAQSQAPITPPPIAPQPGGIRPTFIRPTATSTVTPTLALSATIPLSPTATPVTILATITSTPTVNVSATVVAPTVQSTITALPPQVVVVTATSMFELPTVTPTPGALLPTATATRPISIATAPPPSPTLSVPTPPSTTARAAAGLAPTPLPTASVPLPASYVAQGSFASQTVYADGSIAQQQGTFNIEQVAAANAYATNQRYALRSVSGQSTDEINVYQIDDYIAVNYTGGDWMLVRRDQGSNIVRAIQPITDLALLFPRIIKEAEFVAQEQVANVTALRYRIDDPSSQGARLIKPLLALNGDIRSLKLEVWIAVPDAYVISYNFQVELADARVLNRAGEEVRADQAVTWTYQLGPRPNTEPLAWPADAPTPTQFPVPGFAPGTFPLPANTELLSLIADMPELISTESIAAVDSFYRTALLELGWTVTGENGLLTCRKEGITLQLLISEDPTLRSTRISVLTEG